jgi:hypothetical protein
MDIEGMEPDALAGAAKCIDTHHPILLVEWIKADKSKLRTWIEGLGYSVFETGMNLLAIHKTDKCLSHLKIKTPGEP